MSASPPAAVLSDALVEAIAGRTVRAAVFATFSFDPGFFEEHVLPLLFDRTFSQVRKVRLLQLEEALSCSQLGVLLGNGKETTDRLGEDVVGSRRFGNGLGLTHGCSSVCHGLQRGLLEVR